MPISYYSGKPRHGKSYSVVARVILPALKAGRSVVTNIPLQGVEGFPGRVVAFNRGNTNMLDIASMLLDDKPSRDYVDYPVKDDLAGAVFVLDEFMFLCPSGVRVAAIDDKVKAFFAMHGHISGGGFSTEIVLISQDSSQICGMVKAMIDQSFVAEKTMIGKRKIMRLKVYSGCAGVNSGNGKGVYLRAEEHTYDPEVYQYYKSQTLGETHGDETKTDDATNLLKLPALKWLLILALIVIPLTIWFAVKSFNGMVPGAKPVDPGTVQVPVAKPVDPGTVQGPGAKPAQSQRVAMPLDGYKVWIRGNWEYNGVPHLVLAVVSTEGAESALSLSDFRGLGYRVDRLGTNWVYTDGAGKHLLQSRPDGDPEHDYSQFIADAQDPLK